MGNFISMLDEHRFYFPSSERANNRVAGSAEALLAIPR